MIIASIDVGTNTVLLLVARGGEHGTLIPLVEAYRIPRLGAGVDSDKILRPEAIRRVITVLLEYNEIIARHAVDRIVACGTSAVRDAANRLDFLDQVRRETGLHIEILSGDEEALWSYQGAVSSMENPGHLLVLDIGGGSTELIWGDNRKIIARTSLNIGAVRLTERCFLHDPPAAAELDAASSVIDKALATSGRASISNAELVAVAGTPAALATLALGLERFSQDAVAGHVMRRTDIERMWELLRSLPSSEIRKLSEVLEGRADIITAGTLILRKVMDRFALGTMTVSTRGLRYGMVLREIGPMDQET
jgi:exopolyphosphatase/guanosine-5'-triphosphate,3'-diphosphate pyrophosphatase